MYEKYNFRQIKLDARLKFWSVFCYLLANLLGADKGAKPSMCYVPVQHCQNVSKTLHIKSPKSTYKKSVVIYITLLITNFYTFLKSKFKWKS